MYSTVGQVRFVPQHNPVKNGNVRSMRIDFDFLSSAWSGEFFLLPRNKYMGSFSFSKPSKGSYRSFLYGSTDCENLINYHQWSSSLLLAHKI